MAFYWRDNVIYDEGQDKIPAAAVTAGTPEQLQDVFGFWLTDAAAGAETTFVYRCRQVLADKLTGTGEAIVSLDRVYAVVAQNHFITANPVGVAGTDYYFCGWAKEDASASATQVLINFDGTRWDEDI